MAEIIPNRICYKCGERLSFNFGTNYWFCHDQCGLVECWGHYKYGSCDHLHCIKFGKRKEPLLTETPAGKKG